MDCDQVFMVLTRGPFPTGEIWDEEVESPPRNMRRLLATGRGAAAGARSVSRSDSTIGKPRAARLLGRRAAGGDGRFGNEPVGRSDRAEFPSAAARSTLSDVPQVSDRRLFGRRIAGGGAGFDARGHCDRAGDSVVGVVTRDRRCLCCGRSLTPLTFGPLHGPSCRTFFFAPKTCSVCKRDVKFSVGLYRGQPCLAK